MPPKKTRGAVRGRGRGGSSGPAAPPQPAESGPATENQQSESSSEAHRLPFNITPENTENEDQPMTGLDPNDSPATQPTETPAPTPIRLTSSLQMQAADSVDGSGARGGAPRGRAKESRFKPRNVRRSAAELQAVADQERDKAAAIAADAARARGRGNAFRGRAGRGRGDAMGRGRGAASATASGPFAEVPEIGRRGAFFAPSSGTKQEGGPSTSRSTGTFAPNIKSEHGSTARFTHSGSDRKTYIPDPQYPDEEDGVARIDIQHINLVSSDEEDGLPTPTQGSKAKKASEGKSSRGGLKPVRLDRHEHKERKSQVNTAPAKPDPSTEGTIDSDTPMIDESRSTNDSRPAKIKVFKGAYIDDDDIKVKDEPGETTDPIDQIAPAHRSLGSTAQSKSKAGELDSDEDEESEEDGPSSKLKKKAPAKKRVTEFVIQTEEDRKEWERHLEDLDVLKEELGGMQPSPTDKGKGKEGEATGGEKPADKKEGRLYLFQFPPGMPKLYNAATTPNPNITRSDDVQITGSTDKTVMNLEKGVKTEVEEIIVKKEDDESTKKKPKDSLATEDGYVGKLIVRESGRVELDWGGSRMLVGRGIETSFLTMGVLVDSKGCFDGEGKPTKEGVATGMGKIMGKFVVTPDWESMVEDMDKAERR